VFVQDAGSDRHLGIQEINNQNNRRDIGSWTCEVHVDGFDRVYWRLWVQLDSFDGSEHFRPVGQEVPGRSFLVYQVHLQQSVLGGHRSEEQGDQYFGEHCVEQSVASETNHDAIE